MRYMGDMNIRGIPDEMLRGWKLDAIAEGKTLRQWVIDRLGESGAAAPVSVAGSKPPRTPGGKPAAARSARHSLTYHPDG